MDDDSYPSLVSVSARDPPEAEPDASRGGGVVVASDVVPRSIDPA